MTAVPDFVPYGGLTVLNRNNRSIYSQFMLGVAGPRFDTTICLGRAGVLDRSRRHMSNRFTVFSDACTQGFWKTCYGSYLEHSTKEQGKEFKVQACSCAEREAQRSFVARSPNSSIPVGTGPSRRRERGLRELDVLIIRTLLHGINISGALVV